MNWVSLSQTMGVGDLPAPNQHSLAGLHQADTQDAEPGGSLGSIQWKKGNQELRTHYAVGPSP